MNNISLKQYHKIKNKTLIVVFFEGGVRQLTFGGCDYVRAVEEILNRTCRYQESAYMFEALTMDTGLIRDEKEFLKAAARDAELLQLIKDGCDGGNGEFENYIPECVAERAEKYDHTFEPVVNRTTIEWIQVK